MCANCGPAGYNYDETVSLDRDDVIIQEWVVVIYSIKYFKNIRTYIVFQL